jgi:rSAM/selenodomain-associated transferase 2
MSARRSKRGLSIIVPTLNEEAGIEQALIALAPLRDRGAEIIVADGGGEDATISRALRHCDLVVNAPRGRAMQMNAGAARATAKTLLFLHADTRLPADADTLIESGLLNSGREWGRFDIDIRGRPPMLRVIAAMMNARSTLTGVCTGDQAIFARADAFHAVGGFPDIALMEDIAFSTAMRRRGPPLRLRSAVVTSGKRWETNGVWRTIFLMWRLRAAYFFGADPAELAKRYGYRPRD